MLAGCYGDGLLSPDGGESFGYSLVSPPTGGVVLLTRQKYPKAAWGKPQDPDAPERPLGTAVPSRSVG